MHLKNPNKNPQTELDRASLEANGPKKQTTHISARLPVSVKPIRSCHPLPQHYLVACVLMKGKAS